MKQVVTVIARIILTLLNFLAFIFISWLMAYHGKTKIFKLKESKGQNSIVAGFYSFIC